MTTTKPETLADLEGIFQAGAVAINRTELSEQELTEVLDRLDDATTFGGSYFTPGNPAPMRAYYDFINQWYEQREGFPEEVNAHYDETLKKTTVAIFQRLFDGLIIEAVRGEPDLLFLDVCLDELIALSCPNGCEDEFPFVCVPEHRQVLALKRIGKVDGLENPDDIEALLDHLDVTRLIHGDCCFALDDESFEYNSPDDELKSVQFF